MPAASSIFLRLGQNKKFSDRYRLAKQAQSTIYSTRSLRSQQTTAPTIGSIVRVKTARPAAWSTANFKTAGVEPARGLGPAGQQEGARRLVSRSLLCVTSGTPYGYKGKQWLVRELPVNRGHTEVFVLSRWQRRCPSAGTITLQVELRSAQALIAPALVACGARPFRHPTRVEGGGSGGPTGNRPLKDECHDRSHHWRQQS